MEIVVGTNSDASNGDVTSVGGLIANPGPDGVSLREAVEASSNDPGSYTIRFTPALAGATILVGASPPARALPALTGGGVTIEGDIDGNRSPDVTLRPTAELMRTCCVHSGLQIASSNNRLHALTIEGFHTGVELEPAQLPLDPLPTHRTFANNVLTGVVIRGVHEGILLGSVPGCPNGPPCPSYNRWTNTTITGNTIAIRGTGVHVTPSNSIGDRVEGLTVTENTIRVGTRARPGILGPGIQVDIAGYTTDSRISNVLIARNSIEGVQASGDGAIVVASGLHRAQDNTIDGVRIVGNRVHVVRPHPSACCYGIVIYAGGDTWAVNFRPVNYPNRNVVRNVEIAGNTVTGSLATGLSIQAGVFSGGSSNRIENVRVQRNVISATTNWGKGIYLWVGDHAPGKPGAVRRPGPAVGNRIAGVVIDRNRITNGRSKPAPEQYGLRDRGGIVLTGGFSNGRRGVIRDVRVTGNRIAAYRIGIRLVGGLEPTARGNRVVCVRLAANRITQAREAVSVISNLGGASGNRASLGGC